MFFTSSTRTRKSLLIREIIAALYRESEVGRRYVAIIASTRIARTYIGGIILYSFAGIRINPDINNDS